MSIEQFKLVKKVGAGNYGTAYKAIDTYTDKEVCVKVFKKNKANHEKTEIVWKADVIPGYEKMNHPNVLNVKGAGSG
jgi:serine/threonine protein kinase